MNSFYVWISVLTPLYEKPISSALLAKGYIISPTDGELVATGNCLAYLVRHANRTLSEVEEEIVKIISHNKFYYHMLLVTEANISSRWRGSNIVFNTLSKEEQEIENVMKDINKLLDSFKATPLTNEEKKHLIEKRKNS